jgi:hypothetical protein
MATGLSRLLRCTLYFRNGSKRELPSSGLMSASAGCGHSDARALGTLVPILLQKSGKKKEACTERRSLSIAPRVGSGGLDVRPV